MSNSLCRSVVSFSMATLPGLVQAYAEAERVLPGFYTQPEKLKAALSNPTTEKHTVESLRRGARLLNCLEILEAGDLEYLGILLRNLAYEAFRESERGGAYD